MNLQSIREIPIIACKHDAKTSNKSNLKRLNKDQVLLISRTLYWVIIQCLHGSIMTFSGYNELYLYNCCELNFEFVWWGFKNKLKNLNDYEFWDLSSQFCIFFVSLFLDDWISSSHPHGWDYKFMLEITKVSPKKCKLMIM